VSEFPRHEQDYAFGRVLLTLRTAIGLTQAGLGEYLGVSRRAVGEWEAGNSYPRSEHLKGFIGLAFKQRAFAYGREEEQIRDLWRAAHQRVLLDESWLASLLLPLPGQQPTIHAYANAHSVEPVPKMSGSSRADWGDAPAVPAFYGREWELDLLMEWVVEERCQVVSVIGLGGIGKSALAARLMHGLAERFEAVIWRSVRDAPSCEALLDECFQALAPQALGQVPARQGTSAGIEQRLDLLLEHFRNRRVLLVLDNLEMLLEEGEETGRLLPGYEGYGQLLRQVAETRHQSCLLFTSREKPGALAPLEGSRAPVRVLRLARLGADACERLLAEKDVGGTATERDRLIEAYAGNPLALKIVAQTIVELFDGQVGPFLDQGAIVFGGVRELLARQFNRLSRVEQSIMFWLAIMREPVTFDELRAMLVAPAPPADLLEGVEALRRRSLIERGKTPGSFTLQSVVLEYVTGRLVTEASEEIQRGRPARLVDHSLTWALAREYVRQTQERLIIAPILERMHSASRQPEPGQAEHASVEEQLGALLGELRARADHDQGYGPANVVTLLRHLRGHLRGLDLSGLALRGMYFQGVEMQDASLARAGIRDTVFDDTFDAVLSVAVSLNGAYLAACSRQGDVRLWAAGDYSLQQIWTDRDILYAFALSPDGRTMVGIDWNGVIKLRAIDSGALLWSAEQPDDIINTILFTHDGRFIATADTKVRLRDAGSGALLQVLQHPAKPQHVSIAALSCSSDGRFLAGGDTQGSIYVWALNRDEDATLLQTIEGHSGPVVGLAFAPEGRALSSASADGTVKLWDVPAGHLHATLPGERGPISRVAWSPDGRTVACGGQDSMVWLWDIEEARYRAVLRGHSSRVKGLAFTPDSHSLLSGSDDGTLRIWDVPGGQCIHTMQGHALAVYSARWSPDVASSRRRLVSAGSDQIVTIYDVSRMQERRPPMLLRGHRRLILGVDWSPDGRWIASCEQDNVVRIWDSDLGACVEVLQHPDDTGTTFYGVGWSPDGRLLAAATRSNGVLLWDMSDMTAPRESPVLQLPAVSSWVSWSPDGTYLAFSDATGGVSDTICVWPAADGTLLQRLGPVEGEIADFAWSLNGRMLAISGRSGEEGAFFVWDIERWECVHKLGGPGDTGSALAWGPSEEMIISGSSDGRLIWWNIESGERVRVIGAHKGLVLGLNSSRDGTRLASCGMDGAIMLWDLRTGAHLETVRRDRPYERLDITEIRGLTPAQVSTLRALGAVGIV
jgi:WD40 repeat protein/transcriptional regulator with XRE-family HTH domain